MSSFANFLFGNIDNEGRLDDENLDQTLVDTLNSVDSSDLSLLFSTNVSALGLADNDLELDEAAESGDEVGATDSANIAPDADAVDYSDFNEVADMEDQIYTDKYVNIGLNTLKFGSSSMGHARPSDDDYDDVPSTPVKEETMDYDVKPLDAFLRNVVLPPPLILPPASHRGSQRLPELPPTNSTYALPIPPSVPSVGTPAPLTTIPAVPLAPTIHDIQKLYPSFRKDAILNFSELFATRVSRKRFHKTKKVPPRFAKDIRLDVDTRTAFENQKHRNSTILSSRKDHVLADNFTLENERYKPLESAHEDDIYLDYRTARLKREATSSPSYEDLHTPTSAHLLDQRNAHTFHSIMLNSWEEDITWDQEDTIMEDCSRDEESALIDNGVYNSDLMHDSWVESIIWDEYTPYRPFLKLSFNLNDTRMLFDVTEGTEIHQAEKHDDKSNRRSKKKKPHSQTMAPPKAGLSDERSAPRLDVDRFNLSNDAHYEAQKEGKLQRVRQTFGQLVVQHSLPALKLQHPFFKTRLSKAELRSFHRPSLQFPPNQPLHFSRVKAIKTKKLKKKDAIEVMRTTKDLTLKDNTNFVLFEYTEEYPPIITNIGMGTLLINYYRKIDSKDSFVPHEEIGDAFVLDVADASPFMNFGNVDPGQTIPILYSNLIKAPLFRHDVRSTDFLVVRNTYKGQTKYYVREIPYLFAVGQTYPVQEVPAPHSRKITNTVKNRLQMTTYRAMRKSPGHRLSLKQISALYPEYNDLQMRQKLKEFCEFVRRGHNNGFWKPKGRDTIPSEEELRKLVTPEMVCLYEAMLVGQRHLQDTGYGKTAEDDVVDDEGEAKLDIEEQLAPWITTRNFMNATQGKAMLKLYGPGDPTGRGEGFSFIRISMKDIFLRAGENAEEKLAKLANLPKSAHRYNVAEQQQIYKEEIDRIWRSQFDALSDKNEIQLSDDEGDDGGEDERMRGYSEALFDADDRIQFKPDPESRANLASSRFSRGGSRQSSPPMMGQSPYNQNYRGGESDDDMASVAGSVSSRTSCPAGTQNKFLVIRRMIRGPNGETNWQSEVVKDAAVMNAYLRHRQLIEEQMTAAEELEPTDDVEKNRRMQQRIEDQLARLKRNQERRRARQAMKETTMPQGVVAKSSPVTVTAPPRKETVRRCGNCGALGHMKTNRKCPMFKENAGGGSSTPGGNSTPVATGSVAGDVPASRQGSEMPDSERITQTPAPQAEDHGNHIKLEGTKLSIPKFLLERVEQSHQKLSVSNRTPNAKAATKRKRTEQDQEKSQPTPKSQTHRRKHHADVELADLFEKILIHINTLPEATPFLAAVSAKAAPDYYTIVRNPKDLSMIRDANKNLAYKCANAFLGDLTIMRDNCRLYNGERHPFTGYANRVLEIAEGKVHEVRDDVQRIEEELEKESLQPVRPPGSTNEATGFSSHILESAMQPLDIDIEGPVVDEYQQTAVFFEDGI